MRTAQTRTIHITNPHGLHARPCLAIVNTVRRYHAQVTVRKNGQTADAASILDLMSLGATQGTELVLAAKGPDAQQALNALAHLLANEFDVLAGVMVS